jgi:hypothetical protein
VLLAGAWVAAVEGGISEALALARQAAEVAASQHPSPSPPSGLSNRDIAQRLVVWVRTVENHLYRVSTKLGTTDRTALLHGH